ncbi:ABC transporter [Tetzosporium hominis]|uniref:ABC transporter n=1 Tax=Tetzosporium hominis TaxID=2020506 RepID=A0A264W203_9BACL|nr:AarF/UbiB family protein [Tetzosporium hominis]OZS77595.1 ABC transporter [Tetzosporium hominis]
MKNVAWYRMYRIVWMSIKFFLQVYFFQRKYRGRFTPVVQAKWERLIVRQATEYKETALYLGGLMIKVGQFLSARADVLPQAFIEELEGLTDRVPPVERDLAMKVIEEEWGGPVSKYVTKISDESIASASIGEVYKATLLDGRDVAIKIQRPGIERIIRYDFKAMRVVIWLAKRFTTFTKQIDFDLLYREMESTLLPELDFLQELQHGRSFHQRFNDLEGICFPIYFEEYSTRRVLVMEWIEGTRITNISFMEQHGIDPTEVTERLFLLFMEQVLRSGEFHADPHAGNMMIQPDGTIVLLDFGMVGSITPAQTRSIIKAIQGILLDNDDQILDALEELNFLLPNADRPLLADTIRRMIHAYETNELSKMDSYVVERLLTDIRYIVRTQPVQLPAEFAFFGRALTTFVGVLHALDPNVDLLELGKPRILAWARERATGQDSTDSQERFFSWLQKGAIPLQKAYSLLDEPARLRKLIEATTIEKVRVQHVFLDRAVHAVMGAISLIAFFAGIFFQHVWLATTSAVFGIVFLRSFYKKR